MAVIVMAWMPMPIEALREPLDEPSPAPLAMVALVCFIE